MQWQTSYAGMRTNNEPPNNNINDGTGSSLADASRRPARGFTEAFFFSAILVMHTNLKTLGRWKVPKMDSQDRGPHRVIKERKP